MRLVILGGVAAGTKAASRARRLDPEMEITVYQEEPEPSISECGLPYLLSGVVEERDDLVARTPEKFAEKDIDVLVRHRVERIDATGKNLSVLNLKMGQAFEDAYDRLVFATGARAVLPPIPGAELAGVFKLRFLTDSDGVRSYVEEHSPKKATIVGVGIRPNVELAAEAGVEIGSTGAILVDRHMKTNVSDVWAAGDCVETINL